MAAPSICSYKSFSNMKQIVLRQISVNEQMTSGGRFVLSSSVSSSWRRSEMYNIASRSGNLVKRLTTSKLTMIVSSSASVSLISQTNSATFFTNDSVFPVRGCKILANNSFAML